MQVNSTDICVQGFERLRSNSEFILVAYVGPDTTKDEVISELISYWRNADRGIEASDDDVRAVLVDAIGTGKERIAPDLDPVEEGDDAEGCCFFVYLEA